MRQWRARCGFRVAKFRKGGAGRKRCGLGKIFGPSEPDSKGVGVFFFSAGIRIVWRACAPHILICNAGLLYVSRVKQRRANRVSTSIQSAVIAPAAFCRVPDIRQTFDPLPRRATPRSHFGENFSDRVTARTPWISLLSRIYANNTGRERRRRRGVWGRWWCSSDFRRKGSLGKVVRYWEERWLQDIGMHRIFLYVNFNSCYFVNLSIR